MSENPTDDLNTGGLTPEEFKQMDAEESAKAAIDSLKRDQVSADLASQADNSNQKAIGNGGAYTPAIPDTPDNNPRKPPSAYRGPTEAELKAKEQEQVRSHPFVLAVKEFLDAFAPEPKLGRLDHLYQNLRREYRDVTGESDARAVVTGAGSEHESLRSPEAAD